MRRAFLALVFLACRSPGPVPPTPPPPDAGPGGDIFQAACMGLRRASCAEGWHPACETVLRMAEETRVVDFHVECLARAMTRFDVRSCGPEVTCEPPGSL